MTSPADLLRASPLAPLDARILLAHALDWPRTALITRADEALPLDALERFRALEARRANGEPVAHIVEQREFFGLAFAVSADVLIPRPETELLVELTLAAIDGIVAPCVLDLGTGSGAIAVSVAHARPDARVVATDRSAAALAVAQRNALRLVPRQGHGSSADGRPGSGSGAAPSRITFLLGNWFDALAHTTSPIPTHFHAIVSNPPYIVAGDPHLAQGDLRFEPADALTDHADGLDAIRAIVEGAPARLLEGGALWIEHGFDQADAVRVLLAARGFDALRSEHDLAGIARASGGIWRQPR
jgi:release factor glutamine methyltransferase